MSYKNILMKITSQEIQSLDVSWILTFYYRESKMVAKKSTYDFVLYHYFCNQCGCVDREVKKCSKNYTFNNNIHTCSKCTNRQYLHEDYKNHQRTEVSYLYSFGECSDYFYVIATMKKPTYENGTINLLDTTVFEIKFLKSKYTTDITYSNLFLNMYGGKKELDIGYKILTDKIIKQLQKENPILKEKMSLYPYFKENKLEFIKSYLENKDSKELELLLLKKHPNKKFYNLKEYLYFIGDYKNNQDIQDSLHKYFYNTVLTNAEKFQYKYAYLVCREFKNFKLIGELLEKKVPVLCQFDQCNLMQYSKALQWLKKYYSEENIVQLFLYQKNNIRLVYPEYLQVDYIWREHYLSIKNIFELIVDINEYSSSLLNQKFHKVKCDLESIYNALLAIANTARI